MKTTLEIRNNNIVKPSRNGLKYYVKTFGCQMNEHDSQRIAGLFEKDGMSKANSLDESDILFVNTCTIRENADDKLYGTLGQLKKWKKQDPISQYVNKLYVDHTNDQINFIYNKALKAVQIAFNFAESSPFPDNKEAFQNIYA